MHISLNVFSSYLVVVHLVIILQSVKNHKQELFKSLFTIALDIGTTCTKDQMQPFLAKNFQYFFLRSLFEGSLRLIGANTLKLSGQKLSWTRIVVRFDAYTNLPYLNWKLQYLMSLRLLFPVISQHCSTIYFFLPLP